MSFSQCAVQPFTALSAAIIMISLTAVQATCSAHSRSENRIVGGVNVTPKNKYPMMLALENSKRKIVCGGTILNKYYAMTSPLCARRALQVDGTGYVLAGLYQAGEPDPKYTQRILIANTTIHPEYDDDTKGYFTNYIAVVEVAEPFIWNDYVAPTNLPSPCWGVFEDRETKAVSVGWGFRKGDQYQYDVPLQEVELPLLTTDTCQRKLSFERFTHDQLCIDPIDGAGPCIVDYGGPLFLYNEENEKHIQIGMHLIVDPDCAQAVVINSSWFLNVARYVHWIDNAIRVCSPVRKPKTR